MMVMMDLRLNFVGTGFDFSRPAAPYSIGIERMTECLSRSEDVTKPDTGT
jgi:hypothetical protein